MLKTGWRAQVYACPLEGGARAVVLFNRHVGSDNKFGAHNITVFWKSIGLPTGAAVRGYNGRAARRAAACARPPGVTRAPAAQATVRDLYLRKDLGEFTGAFTGLVPTHSVLALKLTPSRCGRPSAPRPPFWPARRLAARSCASASARAVGGSRARTTGGRGRATGPWGWSATSTTGRAACDGLPVGRASVTSIRWGRQTRRACPSTLLLLQIPR